MKKILTTILILLILFLLCITLAHFMLKDYGPDSSEAIKYTGEDDQPYCSELPAEEEMTVDPVSGRKFLKGEVLLFSKNTTTNQQVIDLVERYNGEIVEHLEAMQLYRVYFSRYEDYAAIEKLLTILEDSNLFDMINLNEIVEQETKFLIPNDPWSDDETVEVEWTEKPEGRNWGIEAIRAPQAWPKITGDNTVNLGIIDTPLESSPSDLKEVVHLEQGVAENKNSKSNHGMHVAGTMAATFNNKTAVSGVCTNDKLISGDLFSATSDVLAIIHKMVVDEKIKVINYSAGFRDEIIIAAQKGNQSAIKLIEDMNNIVGQGLKKLIDNGHDFLICAAAGNTSNQKFYADEASYYGYYLHSGRIPPCRFWLKKSESILSDAQWASCFSKITDDEIKSRIIVVGSVGLDQNSAMRYSSFSGIGERVDVVAPGEDIYSLSWDGKVVSKRGTSMATPHVSGLAGLLLQLNPDLTGPQLKNIIVNTATGDYKYDETHGKPLIQADAAADIALNTESEDNVPIVSGSRSGLDLCFVIDTTRSMEDDIADVKNSISEIITAVQNKSENYRIAFVSYRDFPERTGDPADYPSEILMPFTNDANMISRSLDDVGLGYGGDDAETVFSGLMTACRMNWRSNSSKFIILMGDAPALDPEPNTNYTYDDILNILKTTSISIDQEYSTIDTVLPDQAFWSVYSIAIGDDVQALDFLKNLAEDTGGTYKRVSESSEVSGAIIETVDSFEIKENVPTTLMLGKGLSGYTVSILDGQGNFVSSAPVSDKGKVQFDNLTVGSYYHWQSGMAKGIISISETGEVINMSTQGVLLSTIVNYVSNTFVYILISVIVILMIILLLVILSLHKKQSLIKYAYPKRSERRQLIKNYNNKILTEKRIKKNKKQHKKELKEQKQRLKQQQAQQQKQVQVEKPQKAADQVVVQQTIFQTEQQFKPNQDADNSKLQTQFNDQYKQKQEDDLSTAEEKILFCGNCGNKIGPNDTFCRECGKKIH